MDIQAAIGLEAKLEQLQWPDKEIIFDITGFLDRNSNLSGQLSNILISRILDPSINVCLKIPLMYLVDSILRNNNQAYISYISPRIVEVFACVSSQVFSSRFCINLYFSL